MKSQADVRSTAPGGSWGNLTGISKASGNANASCKADDDGTLNTTVYVSWITNGIAGGHYYGQNFYPEVYCRSDVGVDSVQLQGVCHPNAAGWLCAFTHGGQNPVVFHPNPEVGGIQLTRTSSPLQEDDAYTFECQCQIYSEGQMAAAGVTAQVTVQ